MTHRDMPQPALADKVAFLLRPDAYAHPAAEVVCRETHMSYIFLAGDFVYKLKKPVRFPYLDFSTLVRRERACNAEFALNRRLARDVYLGVVALTQTGLGLELGGSGDVVDWLVMMRRLDEEQTLDYALKTKSLRASHIHRLTSALAAFYRHANPVFTSGASQLAGWHRSLADNSRVLLDPHLGMPTGRVRIVDRAQRRFLRERADVLEQRTCERLIVDGHGDLRSEHIWLSDPIRIIDCLEFNAQLRAVDPADEIAFLCLECERLGSPWASEIISRHTLSRLRGGVPRDLFLFYRCHRATLRARLAIAHLMEAHPRTPEKWRPLALVYLAIAAADARRLDRCLDTHESPHFAQDQRHLRDISHVSEGRMRRTSNVQASPDCDRRL